MRIPALPFPSSFWGAQIDYYVAPVVSHSVISVMKCENGSTEHYQMTAAVLNLMNFISGDAFFSVNYKYAIDREMYNVLERIPEMLAWDGSVLLTTPLTSLFRSAFVQGTPLAPQIEQQKESIKSQLANYFYSFL